MHEDRINLQTIYNDAIIKRDEKAVNVKIDLML